MGRYERINDLARAWATPTFGVGPRVIEWEVKVFEPGRATNTVRYCSPREAAAEAERLRRGGTVCEGPYPAPQSTV